MAVTPILTDAGARFVTPLSLGSLACEAVHLDLFSLTDEAEMGHIETLPVGRPGGGRAAPT